MGRMPKITDRDFVLFCGAGISESAPSSAPLWTPMRDAIIQGSIDRTVKAGSNWDQPYPARMAAFAKHPVLSRIAPEILFQVVEASLGIGPFASLLASVGLGKPNKNHRAIAALADRGHISSIVTTNFDCHIEQCLSDIGVPFVTLPDESSVETWKDNSRGAQGLVLFKIHGSLDRTASLVATVKAAGRTLSRHKACALRDLLSTRQVLLIGYSGRDYDVFPALLDLVKAHLPAHVFVSALKSVTWPLDELAVVSKGVTAVTDTSAEALFDQLCENCGIELVPKIVAEEPGENWRVHIQDIVDGLPVADLVIFLGQLAFLVGDVETALSPFFIIARDLAYDALGEERSVKNIRRAAVVHTALARCHINLGTAPLANSEKEQARQLYVELGEEYTTEDERALWWCRTNGTAWLSIQAGEAKAAETLFRNSVKQAERHRDKDFQTIGDETLVDAYIGLGDSLLLQARNDDAEASYRQALNISEEFGSLWLAARADLALAKVSRVTNAAESTAHIAAAKRRLSYMGLAVEDIVGSGEDANREAT